MLPKIPEQIKPLVPKEFRLVLASIDIIVDEVGEFAIIEEEHIEQGGRYIKAFKAFNKKLEQFRKDMVTPLNDQVKGINNAFKDIKERYNDELIRLETEMQALVDELERKAKEEQEREQKELEEQIEKEKEIFGDDESNATIVPTVEIKSQKLSDRTQHMTTMRLKKWRVTDIDKVPREYLNIDEQKLNALRKTFGYEVDSPIPGVEFYTLNKPITK